MAKLEKVASKRLKFMPVKTIETSSWHKQPIRGDLAVSMEGMYTVIMKQ